MTEENLEPAALIGKLGVDKALIFPDDPEKIKYYDTEPLFAASDIIQNLPLGVNAVRAICQNCGFTGFIDKQVTDGYDPYCTRCGEQSLEEGVEESLVVRSKFKELIQSQEVEER